MRVRGRLGHLKRADCHRTYESCHRIFLWTQKWESGGRANLKQQVQDFEPSEGDAGHLQDSEDAGKDKTNASKNCQRQPHKALGNQFSFSSPSAVESLIDELSAVCQGNSSAA